MISTESAASVVSDWGAERVAISVGVLLGLAAYHDFTGASVFFIPADVFAAASYLLSGACITAVCMRAHIEEKYGIDWEAHG